MIIVNLYAALIVIASFAAWGIGQGINYIIDYMGYWPRNGYSISMDFGDVLAGLSAIFLDYRIRIHSNKRKNLRMIHPTAGGSLFGIPIWVLGLKFFCSGIWTVIISYSAIGDNFKFVPALLFIVLAALIFFLPVLLKNIEHEEPSLKVETEQKEGLDLEKIHTIT